MFLRLFLVFQILSVASFARTELEKSKTKNCFDKLVTKYPKIKSRANYYEKHEIMIEKMGDSKKIIHSLSGSSYMRQDKTPNCKLNYKLLGGREIKGISGFLSAAISNLVQTEKIPEVCITTGLKKVNDSIKDKCCSGRSKISNFGCEVNLIKCAG